ncbi:hypothetical protein ABZ235_10100 [Streptomyces canus]|uniref:hypothetical protein n=1 Tax=Streptomyces canus TaxID=58343 RepID=UPI0033B972AE
MTVTVSYAPTTAPTGSAPALLDPQTTRVSAVWLMAAVRYALRTSAMGRLMEDAARLRTVTPTERAVEAVRDAEGCGEAPGPSSRPRIPAVTALVFTMSAVVLPTPHPAKGAPCPGHRRRR